MVRAGIRCAGVRTAGLREGTWWSCAETLEHPAAGTADLGGGAAGRIGRYSPGPVPDRLPEDPHHRLAVPAAGHRGIHADDSGAGDPQPADRRRERGARAVHPRRLPAGGLDRAVRLQGDPDAGGARGRPHRGGGLRHAGAGRGHRRLRTSRTRLPACLPARPPTRLPARLAPRWPGPVPLPAPTPVAGRGPGHRAPCRWWSARSAPSRWPPWPCSESRWSARAVTRGRGRRQGHPEDRQDRRRRCPRQRRRPYLYWFAPDTSTSSRCFGSCAIYWPPVSGSPAAGPGVTGKLGTIKRSGGGLQATYDGHRLYAYIGDRGPGQANGNDLDLNGGFWYDIRMSH